MKFELLGFHSRAGCLLRNQNSRSAFKGKPSWLCGCYRESSAKIACITYVSMNRIQKMVIFITWFFRRPWHVCATVDKRTYSRPLHIHTRYSIVNGALFEIFNTKESIYIINCCSVSTIRIWFVFVLFQLDEKHPLWGKPVLLIYAIPTEIVTTLFRN